MYNVRNLESEREREREREREHARERGRSHQPGGTEEVVVFEE